MPKGVYNRNKGINTVVADEAPRTESANAQAVVVSRQTHGEEEMSTTSRLFGDLAQEEAIKEIPVSQDPGEEQKVKPEPEVPSETTPEVPPVTPEVPAQTEAPAPTTEFDINKMSDQMVKIKVDGVEENITLKELRDRHQLKKHLDMAADKVGEERRKLAEERRQLQELRSQQRPTYQDPAQPQAPQYESAPRNQIPQELDPLVQKIQFLEARMNQVLEGTRPVVYESNRQRVSNELKSQGFNDFLDYIPKMESFLVGQQDQNLVSFYDTPAGAKALYFQLKAQDLQQSMSRPQAQAPVAPVLGARPPITKIDGGNQPSGSVNDDASAQYRQTFKRAVNSDGDKEAWNAVLRQKGIISD